MTAIQTTQPGYIHINGVPFLLEGPVSPALLSTPPARVVVGDDESKTEPLLNVLSHADASMGLGLYKMTDSAQTQFCWFSLLNPYGAQLMLPEETVTMGPPAGVSSPGLEVLFDHGSVLYGSWNNTTYSWNDAGSAWSAAISTLPAAATDAVSYYYNGTEYAYIASSGNLTKTADPATGAAYSNLGVNAKYLIVWDGKLFRYDATNGKLYGSTDNAATWGFTSEAIPVPYSYVQGLALYYDANGDTQIYASTRQGLYVLDYTNSVWTQTKLVVPTHQDAGKGGIEWRNDFFFSAGLDIYRYIVAPTATVSDVGLNRMDGVPAELRGTITKLVKGHNELYALLDASVAGSVTDPYLAAGAYRGGATLTSIPPVASARGYSAVLAWNGVGWRTLWRSGSTALPGTVIYLSQADSKQRLVWGSNQNAYYVELPRTIRNPRHNPTQRFSTAGSLTHETPWFNAFAAGRTKLATGVFARFSNLASGRTATLEYALDMNDSAWYPLRSSTSGAIDNVFTADGEYERSLESALIGQKFDYIKFRLTLATDDATQTPICEYLGLFYAVVPRQRWGYTFTIVLSDSANYGSNATAKQQRDALRALLPSTDNDPALVTVQYHDAVTNSDEYLRGLIFRVQGSEESGSNWQGRYTISFAQVN